MQLTADQTGHYNPTPDPIWGVWFMKFGKVRSRVRSGREEWWVEVSWEGKRYTFSSIPIYYPNHIEWYPCESKDRAEFLKTIIQDRIKDGKFNPWEFRKHSPMRFRQYAEEWLKGKKPNIGNSTFKTYRYAIDTWLVPKLGEMYLPNITKTVLRDLQNKIDREPKTKKNVMDTLSNMLRDACPDYIQNVPQFPGFKGNESIIPADIKVPALEDVFKIIGKIPDKDRHIFLFMVFTGCRPSEARAFRKEDIRGDHIMFVKTFDNYEQLAPVKGKKPLPFPMTQSLKNLLDEVPPNLTPHVFVNPNTGKPYTHKFTAIWNQACKDAEFGYLKMYNCTRHAFATMMRIGGMDLADIKDLMRHADIKTTMRYDHSSVIRLAKKVDNVLHLPNKKSVGKVLAKKKEASK